MAKKTSAPPTAADRAAFQAKHGKTPIECGVGMKRDKDGVFVHTHRARSKSYPSADKIPTGIVKRIESTG